MALSNIQNSVDAKVNVLVSAGKRIIEANYDDTDDSNDSLIKALTNWDVSLKELLHTDSENISKQQYEQLLKLHTQVSEIATEKRQDFSSKVTKVNKGKKAVAAYGNHVR